MRRIALMLMALFTLAIPTGCGEDAVPPTPSTSKASSAAVSSDTVSSASDSEDSTRVSPAASSEKQAESKNSSKSSSSGRSVSTGYPVIEQDKDLISPLYGISEYNGCVYAINPLMQKHNLLRIDTAKGTITPVTDSSVGLYLLSGNLIYYTTTDPATGGTTLYVRSGQGKKALLQSKQLIANVLIYQNKIYYQLKDTGLEDYLVYRMDLDGKNILKLVQGSIINIFKGKIYYYRQEDIYSMGTDGKGKAKLSSFLMALTVRPDAVYYFQDHPAPRGMELRKRTLDGADTRLCSADGYQFGYTPDHYLTFISHEQTLVKMRLDGSDRKTLVQIPENLLSFGLSDKIFYSWISESSGDVYFCWSDLKTGKSLGKLYWGNDPLLGYPDDTGSKQTSSREPVIPWTTPYDPVQMAADCRSFAESMNLRYVENASPEQGTGSYTVSTFETGSGAKEVVLNRIAVVAIAGQDPIGVNIQADPQHSGHYIIAVIYGIRSSPSSAQSAPSSHIS